jgi:glutamate dehydrogenase
MNEEQRNQLLAEMTDEVGALVLRDNYFQAQSLSVRKKHAAGRPNALHQISGKGRQAQP